MFLLISLCLYKTPIFSDIRPLQIVRGQTSLGGWYKYKYVYLANTSYVIFANIL